MSEKTSAFQTLIFRARDHLAYSLSLPERTLRSLAALVGGGTTLLTETLLPESLRSSSSYRISLGLFQAFLIENVARIERETSSEEPLQDKFVQRKLIGNILEAAGLLTLRFSPLWVLAIVADAAGGSKHFLNELVARLKANGVIGEEAAPDNLVDVLEAVQEVSRRSATAFDTPPLSREELTELIAELKEGYGSMLKESSELLPQLDSLWEQMQTLARRDGFSLERLLGVMTLEAAEGFKKGVGTATALGQTGAALFEQTILESYRQTLKQVATEGLDGYMGAHMQPFLKSARAHFDPKQQTWLEAWLRAGSHLRKSEQNDARS